jgi:hypothetical protein
MSDKEPKLGDVIDDYCSRCRLIMNHGIVGLVEHEVKRVRCNTCLNEHAYRHAKVPKKKKDSVQDLFDQVLARIPSQPEKPTQPPKPARSRTPHLGTRPRAPEPPPEPEEPRQPAGKGRRRTPHLGARTRAPEPSQQPDKPRKRRRRRRRGKKRP